MNLYWAIKALQRQRTVSILIAIEIALTCAIVCNTLFLVGDRVAHVDRESGVVEDELIRVRVATITTPDDAKGRTAEDLAALRALPGVKNAVVANIVPFGNASWNTAATASPDDPSPPVEADEYMGGLELLDTLGTQLVAGRRFEPGELMDFNKADPTSPPTVIITRALADRLFPGGAIGRSLYTRAENPMRVVGVVEALARPSESGAPETSGYSMILPMRMTYPDGRNYLIRVAPEQRDAVLAKVEDALYKVDVNRIIVSHEPFAAVRAAYFQQDTAMIYLLIGLSIALLAITTLGLGGLASFSVQRRTQQIGCRRALGATRSDILRLFQLENFVLASCGIAVGMLVAYGLNWLLRELYDVSRLPGYVLPIGAIVVWLVGQLAVLGPALKASRLSPAIATRTV
ncbi:MAG TPA: FtsX-like permease family protein [Kofleriaceae bacterium]|nr:FtsX-like permease family protein [Kofleriaceae bacterium]